MADSASITAAFDEAERAAREAGHDPDNLVNMNGAGETPDWRLETERGSGEFVDLSGGSAPGAPTADDIANAGADWKDAKAIAEANGLESQDAMIDWAFNHGDPEIYAAAEDFLNYIDSNPSDFGPYNAIQMLARNIATGREALGGGTGDAAIRDSINRDVARYRKAKGE